MADGGGGLKDYETFHRAPLIPIRRFVYWTREGDGVGGIRVCGATTVQQLRRSLTRTDLAIMWKLLIEPLY